MREGSFSMETRGSITILTSSIFLCVMLVLVTLLESSLIYIGKQQVQRATSVTNQSVLAHYDSTLQEEYGLYGVSSVIPTQEFLEDMMAYNLGYNSGGHDGWNFHNYYISQVTGQISDLLIEPDILEGQILQYMKYRAPLSTLEPLLTQLKTITNSASSGELLKKKTEKVDVPLSELSDNYDKLIGAIEGCYKGMVKENFVRQLEVISGTYYSTIPDSQINQQLHNKLLDHKTLMEFLVKLPEAQELITSIVDIETTLGQLYAQEAVATSDEEKESIGENIADYKEEKDELEIALSQLMDTGETSYKKSLKQMVSFYKDYQKNYKAITKRNKDAIKYIDTIIDESRAVSKGIDDMKIRISKNEDTYDKTLVMNLDKEFREIQKRIGVETLGTMKTALADNYRALEELNDVMDLNLYSTLKNGDSKSFYVIYDVAQKLQNVYTIHFDFDYGPKSTAHSPLKHMKEQVKEAQDNEETAGARKLTPTIKEELPSTVYQHLMIEKQSQALQIDDKGAFKEDFFTSLASLNVMDMSMDFLGEVYINEYALAIFNDYVEASELGDSTAIIQNEIEYILGGQYKDSLNQLIVDGELVLLRSAMNIIHILGNQEKKMAARALAAAIAGWWTAGAGTFVLEGVIIGLWALAEAYMDLKKLKSGQRVAFYKLDADWYLGLDGLINFAIDQVVDESSKAVSTLIGSLEEQLNDQVSHVMNQVGQITETNIDQHLESITEGISNTTESSIQQLDQEINRVIEESLDAVDQNAELSSYNYLDQELVDLLQETVMKQKDSYKQQGSMAVEEALREVREACKDPIIAYQNKLMDRAESAFKDATGKLSTDLQNKAEEQIKKYGQNLKDKLQEASIDKVDLNKKKDVRGGFIKLSYEDYLRVFLLLQRREKTLLRIGDLIQLRMLHMGNEDFRLMNYGTNVMVHSQVSRQLLFASFLNSQVEADRKLGPYAPYDITISGSYK